MAGLSFRVSVSGVTQTLKRMLRVRIIVQSAFRDPRVRNYIVQSVKDRFAPSGSNPRAQTSPAGVKWVAPSYFTVISRKRNRSRFNQALVDTGLLRRSVQIIETRLSDLAIQQGRAGIRVGIPTSSPAYGYGTKMQYGGVTIHGNRIPARPFLGIGTLENRYLTRIIQNYLDAYSRGV
jgi:hypothetical protein